jgi:purine-binding chemotaxis protein CheW
VTESTQYVTLGIDRETFAIPVKSVQEILDIREISRLPHAPDYLLGIIDVRGRSVPVIDLRIKLGLPSVPNTSNTRILVLEVPIDSRIVLLGLVADRVFEVTGFDADQIEPPPEIGTRWRSEYIVGVTRKHDAFVVIFNIARLFADGELATIDNSAARAAA